MQTSRATPGKNSILVSINVITNGRGGGGGEGVGVGRE